MELTVASNNRGKIAEYREILEPIGFSVFSQSEKGIHFDVEETGTTFEENALLKARAVHQQTGGWVLSDDSGLQVSALGGAPGIYSARYLGLTTEQERRQAVLSALRGKNDRSARFVCCICLIGPEGKEHFFTGIWDGTIAMEASGENGFGYDPIFVSADSGGHTTASLPISFKETHSHRAMAVSALLAYLKTENS
ncbi:MAG: RdgB/HAM1 family non-canonical purine NTP pyrophosphatase [Clostridia bacterium]|nr:RdgB/HAM1 family non-canonical purine NTP pyrophosphatase [Clostridia bacterium]